MWYRAGMNNKALKIFQDVLHDRAGLVVSDVQARELYTSFDGELREEVDACAADDTLIRGDILDVLAKRFVGADAMWPIFAEGGHARDVFILKYVKGAIDAGFIMRDA